MALIFSIIAKKKKVSLKFIFWEIPIRLPNRHMGQNGAIDLVVNQTICIQMTLEKHGCARFHMYITQMSITLNIKSKSISKLFMSI